ncbi:hypothetical protein JAAARDRAFT_67768 [Jaapia argillacea MUCL 33604]|uniref:Origin recognition complex subunit 2 n=1 Tax=Jaapia argillacea MUCL 33604 TaxID=933084 RepID=A0A067Q1U3_9AGAM|nr:hypothetical protein JAAARDRAFT_67768 [Jaapia argillacea MUCL 33604]
MRLSAGFFRLASNIYSIPPGKERDSNFEMHLVKRVTSGSVSRSRSFASSLNGNDGDQTSDAEDGGLDIDDEILLSPRKDQGKSVSSARGETPAPSIIAHTSFDAYFIQSSKPSKTSNNVFSSLLPPLSADEYATAIASSSSDPHLSERIKKLEESHSSLFPRYLIELLEGFGLLFYGYGSKRSVLNKFATTFCAKKGHVVVVNAFQPSFALRDLLSSVENVPGVTSLPLPSSSVETQARRIYDFFLAPSDPSAATPAPLFLIIHNIDSPALRTSKARSCLSLLASHPRTHIAASIDHINAPLMWSSSDLFAYPPSSASPRSVPYLGASGDSKRSSTWLWHDLTTLAPYTFETAFSNRSSISGATTLNSTSSRQTNDISSLAMGTAAGAITESAAQHILASVTEKAKKLFALLARMQLAAIEELSAPLPETNSKAPQAAAAYQQNDMSQFATSYSTLFTTSRDNFIATNDTAFKSLLGEFRDHGLVLFAGLGGGAGEVLWIPMRKERLVRIVDGLGDV